MIQLLLLFIFLINQGQSDQVKDFENKLNLLETQLGIIKTELIFHNSQIKVLETELAQINQTVESEINNNKLGCDKDWMSYSDTKCYKVLGKKGSEVEAKGNCSQLDSSSTLITIESKEEQIFLSNRLKDYKNISDFVWIGLEFIDKSFKWMDGKELKIENWGENAVKDGNNKCVQMSLADNELGKWTDEVCQRKYQFVCQKKQSTKTVLRDEIKNLTKVIDKQNQNIENQKKDILNIKNEIQQGSYALIPIGFLYTQLPNQSTPQQLWPNMEWTEVTQQYAGLFFRAEGGGSETFGTVQAANSSSISYINSKSCYIINSYSVTLNCEEPRQYKIEEGKWSKDLVERSFNENLYLYKTSGENRPRNTAIKIWKRSK